MKRPAKSAGLRSTVWHAERETWVSLYDGRAEGLDTSDGRWQVVCERHGSILTVATLRTAQLDVHGDPAEFCEGCREGRDDHEARLIGSSGESEYDTAERTLDLTPRSLDDMLRVLGAEARRPR